jgi:polyhydroxybutyrate depolymerase
MRRVYVRLCALVLMAVAVGCGGETSNNDNGAEDQGGMPFEIMEDLGSGEEDMGDPEEMGRQDMSGALDMSAPLDMPADMGPVDMPPVVEDMALEEDMGPPDLGPLDDLGYPPASDIPLGGDRPVEVILPEGFDNSREVPLVIALHGYGGNKDSVGRYFSLKRNVDAYDFILLNPQGMRDGLNSRFWNATPACCDGFSSGVDDAAYLRGVIEEALGRFRIDRGRIYVAGYSNGGFMAYRLACDSADYITGIFVLAGGTYKDETLCQPSQPVQVLHLHGTADQTIKYDGGSAYPGAPNHPGALESIETWGTYNGCDPGAVMLDASEVDAVTVETASVTGFNNCPQDGQVELWTLPDAPHNPGLPQTIGEYILDRFFAIDRTP